MSPVTVSEPDAFVKVNTVIPVVAAQLASKFVTQAAPRIVGAGAFVGVNSTVNAF